MKVRLTRFIETKTIRFRLCLMTDLSVTPQPGWFLSCYTDCPAIELIVDKVGWNNQREILECILTDKKLNSLDGEAAFDWLVKQYGAAWEIMRVYLTIEALHIANKDV